ncbi:hypothetical protein BGX26_009298 [Mortierella sp. AD094]|nr:hypothetical protein BGX26_009298 [Mortierella sp. AD094]
MEKNYALSFLTGNSKVKRKQRLEKSLTENSKYMELNFDKQHREHPARGCVYLLMPMPCEDEFEGMNPDNRSVCEKGVLIKIGYSSNLQQRLYHHKKKLQRVFTHHRNLLKDTHHCWQELWRAEICVLA